MSGAPAEGAPEALAAAPSQHRHLDRPLRRTRARRAIYALVFLSLVLIAGTIGFHLVAGLDWVNSLYFESMLATGQGPPLTLTTDASKLYASAMAFLSVGSVITTVVFTLGPIVARMWREAAERIEHDARRLEEDLVRDWRRR
jgi:hypothetical protein